MRILFFIESLRSGGKERRLIELIKGLSNNPTIQMEIVLTKDIIHYKEIYLLNVKIHYTKRKEGIKKDPRVFYTFYKIAKKTKPDIIHVWGNLVAIYAIPTKIILKVPMINNQISDADPSKISSSILNHKLTFLFSDKIIANSFTGLKVYNAPIKKSSVIYNGFDFNRIKNLKSKDVIRKRFNITTKLVVGMVASFSDKKDYKTYIRAANILLNENHDITFLCIGEGDSTETEKLVELNNKGKILFLGRLNNVENIMNICDVGVLTTYTEGISNAILEFMALKKPVVITGGGGCKELVQSNINGALFKIGDYIQLSEFIRKLILDDDLKNEFGEKSLHIVREKFSIQSMVDGFWEIYKKVI